MDHGPPPNRLAMLLSLEPRCFLPSWRITVRCGCGRYREGPVRELHRDRLTDPVMGRAWIHTLGQIVERLRCPDCSTGPVSVVLRDGMAGAD